MELNWMAILVAALIPMIVGFIWYHPKVFGNAWMKLVNLNLEEARKMNMLMVLGLTYFLGLLVAMQLNYMVIHQNHLYSIIAGEPNAADPTSEAGAVVQRFMDQYGDRFRTFKHGAFHGALAGLFLALPVLAVNAMFERKSWRYIWINAGFWTLCFILMGGIICGWRLG